MLLKISHGNMTMITVLLTISISTWTALGKVSSDPEVFYLRHGCQSDIGVPHYHIGDGSIIMKLTDYLYDSRNTFVRGYQKMKCKSIIQAPTSYDKLLIQFIMLEVDCVHEDRVVLSDVSHSTPLVLSPNKGICGYYNGSYLSRESRGVNEYRTQYDYMEIDYQGIPTTAYKGFTIILTSYREPDWLSGQCMSSYHLCTLSRMCILTRLRCDGYYNCGVGDQSDELDCYAASGAGGNTVATAVGVTVTTLAILCVVVVAVVIGFKIYTRRRLSTLRRRHDTASAVGYDNNLEAVTNVQAPPSYEESVGGSLNSIAELPPRYSEVVRNKYISTIHATPFPEMITTNLNADESVMILPVRNLDQSPATDVNSAERQGVILSPSTLEGASDITHSVNETLELR